MSKIPVGLVAAAAATVCFASDVASQPSASFPAAQPVRLDARVALLEQRLHALEQRLKPVTELSPQAKSDGSWQLTANGARVVISPQGEVTVQPREGGEVAAPASDCEPPFTVTSDGIRRFKPHCLHDCVVPYVIDARGIRRPKPGCQ